MLTTEPDLMETVSTVSDPRPQETYDEQTIAALAYELWQARGCPEGSPETDWFCALALLRTRKEGDQAASAAV